MNKQEIEHKLDQARIDRTAITIHIDELEKQLTEAEKPKLQHGDFGYLDDYGAYEAVKCAHDINTKRGEILLVSRDGLTSTPANNKVYIDQWHYFGNIFDLLKDWSEDLDRTNIDGFVLEICSDRIVIGGRRFLIKQAEEFWRKLGQMIATLKRKQQ